MSYVLCKSSSGGRRIIIRTLLIYEVNIIHRNPSDYKRLKIRRRIS